MNICEVERYYRSYNDLDENDFTAYDYAPYIAAQKVMFILCARECGVSDAELPSFKNWQEVFRRGEHYWEHFTNCEMEFQQGVCQCFENLGYSTNEYCDIETEFYPELIDMCDNYTEEEFQNLMDRYFGNDLNYLDDFGNFVKTINEYEYGGIGVFILAHPVIGKVLKYKDKLPSDERTMERYQQMLQSIDAAFTGISYFDGFTGNGLADDGMFFYYQGQIYSDGSGDEINFTKFDMISLLHAKKVSEIANELVALLPEE